MSQRFADRLPRPAERAFAAPQRSRADIRLIALQRAAGNRAVTQALTSTVPVQRVLITHPDRPDVQVDTDRSSIPELRDFYESIGGSQSTDRRAIRLQVQDAIERRLAATLFEAEFTVRHLVVGGTPDDQLKAAWDKSSARFTGAGASGSSHQLPEEGAQKNTVMLFDGLDDVVRFRERVLQSLHARPRDELRWVRHHQLVAVVAGSGRLEVKQGAMVKVKATQNADEVTVTHMHATKGGTSTATYRFNDHPRMLVGGAPGQNRQIRWTTGTRTTFQD